MWLFVAVRLIIPLRFKPTAQVTVALPRNVGNMSVMGAAEQGVLSLTFILTLVWLAGMAVFAVCQLAKYISFARITRRWSGRMKDETVIEVFEKEKAAMGIKRGIQIRSCKSVSTPMVFGIVRPVLLMPAMEFEKEDLPAILCHELVHFKRRDILYKLVIMISCCIHWFNPLVYAMYKAANSDIELACDAEVVRSRDAVFRQNYCGAIMRIVHNGRKSACPLSTCFIFSKKNVLERFKNILDEKIKRSGVIMFCVVAVSVAATGGAVGFATERVAEQVEENLQLIERPAEKPEETLTQAERPEETLTPAERPENTDRYEMQPDTAENETAYTVKAPAAVETAPRMKTEGVPPAAGNTQPRRNTAVNDVNIGSRKQEVYDTIGEPDTVSGDGVKETYQLDDGTTAVLQYDDNGVLDEGYIVVGDTAAETASTDGAGAEDTVVGGIDAPTAIVISGNEETE